MEFAGQDKENIRRSSVKSNSELTNKENIQPKTSRNSTGAILKSNLHQRSGRQPLADLNKKQTVRKQVRFDTPEPVNKRRKAVRNTTFVKDRFTPINTNTILLDSTSVSVDTTWDQTCNESSSPENFAISSDDSTFWTSFLTVNNTIYADPHKKVPNFTSSRKVNETLVFKYNDSIIHDSIPSLKRKTLKKQVTKCSGYLGVVNLDPFTNQVEPAVLYSLEYMNDIISHIIQKQEVNILEPELLNNNDNSFLDKRASVINWLVKLNQYLVSDAEVFFMSVRLFDKILTLVAIPESNYQLTAIAAYWISTKYNNSANFVTAKKLLKLCNYVFTAKCLLEMEKTIYLILQFDVVVDDPIVFVYYYIYILQLYESNIIAFCSNYLLELLTLDFNCNTFPLTLQASSAVFLSLKFFNVKEIIWKYVYKYCGYHDKSEMFEVQKIMIKNIILTNDEHCPYKESLRKYSTEKYGKVSLMLPQILERWYNVNDITLLVL